VTPDLDLDESTPSRAADELLVIRCQLGDPEAFDALIARWYPPLWRYVRRMAGRDEDAQDVLQDVWLRVFRGIARLRDGARLRGWLFGIARRTLMDRLRRAYAAPVLTDVDPGDLVAEAEPVDAEADLAALDAGLDALPAGDRELLTLFYLRDLSLAELAEALAVPIGTVKSRLFRARKLLRAVIDERSHA
jgi:RNA polymerase sigma-70 factor (ECF subfamily)